MSALSCALAALALLAVSVRGGAEEGPFLDANIFSDERKLSGLSRVPMHFNDPPFLVADKQPSTDNGRKRGVFDRLSNRERCYGVFQRTALSGTPKNALTVDATAPLANVVSRPGIGAIAGPGNRLYIAWFALSGVITKTCPQVAQDDTDAALKDAKGIAELDGPVCAARCTDEPQPTDVCIHLRSKWTIGSGERGTKEVTTLEKDQAVQRGGSLLIPTSILLNKRDGLKLNSDAHSVLRVTAPTHQRAQQLMDELNANCATVYATTPYSAPESWGIDPAAALQQIAPLRNDGDGVRQLRQSARHSSRNSALLQPESLAVADPRASAPVARQDHGVIVKSKGVSIGLEYEMSDVRIVRVPTHGFTGAQEARVEGERPDLDAANKFMSTPESELLFASAADALGGLPAIMVTRDMLNSREASATLELIFGPVDLGLLRNDDADMQAAPAALVEAHKFKAAFFTALKQHASVPEERYPGFARALPRLKKCAPLDAIMTAIGPQQDNQGACNGDACLIRRNPDKWQHGTVDGYTTLVCCKDNDCSVKPSAPQINRAIPLVMVPRLMRELSTLRSNIFPMVAKSLADVSPDFYFTAAYAAAHFVQPIRLHDRVKGTWSGSAVDAFVDALFDGINDAEIATRRDYIVAAMNVFALDVNMWLHCVFSQMSQGYWSSHASPLGSDLLDIDVCENRGNRRFGTCACEMNDDIVTKKNTWGWLVKTTPRALFDFTHPDDARQNERPNEDAEAVVPRSAPGISRPGGALWKKWWALPRTENESDRDYASRADLKRSELVQLFVDHLLWPGAVALDAPPLTPGGRELVTARARGIIAAAFEATWSPASAAAGWHVAPKPLKVSLVHNGAAIVVEHRGSPDAFETGTSTDPSEITSSIPEIPEGGNAQDAAAMRAASEEEKRVRHAKFLGCLSSIARFKGTPISACGSGGDVFDANGGKPLMPAYAPPRAGTVTTDQNDPMRHSRGNFLAVRNLEKRYQELKAEYDTALRAERRPVANDLNLLLYLYNPDAEARHEEFQRARDALIDFLRVAAAEFPRSSSAADGWRTRLAQIQTSTFKMITPDKSARPPVAGGSARHIIDDLRKPVP